MQSPVTNTFTTTTLTASPISLENECGMTTPIPTPNEAGISLETPVTSKQMGAYNHKLPATPSSNSCSSNDNTEDK